MTRDQPRRLHRASFVVTGLGPVLADGALLSEDGRVLAVGPWEEFAGCDLSGLIVEEHPGRAIIPALVNCHCHLELSHLAALALTEGACGDLCGWIGRLLAARSEAGDAEELLGKAQFALARLYAGGCRALIDIGNLPESRLIGRGFKVEHFFFLELIGLAGARQEAALAQLKEADWELHCSVHAPYSAGPALIRAAKERARASDRLFPIHLAESAQELEFLASGSGALYDFLKQRGALDPSFVVPGCGPVRYLDALGVLDHRTLCVHGVHLDPEEIALLALRGSAVCLCPGSNRFLGVGTAPVPELLLAGVPLVLGTDSLASNPELSLWREMRLLREEHPGLPPEAVFAFASKNGARLLGLDDRLGAIGPGFSSALPAVDCPAKKASEVLDCLTAAGSGIKLEWIE